MKKLRGIELGFLLGFGAAFACWCVTWWWALRVVDKLRVESLSEAALLLSVGLPIVLGPFALSAMFTGKRVRLALWANTLYWLLAAGGEMLEGGTMRPSPYAIVPVALLAVASLVFLLQRRHVDTYTRVSPNPR